MRQEAKKWIAFLFNGEYICELHPNEEEPCIVAKYAYESQIKFIKHFFNINDEDVIKLKKQ